MKKLVIASLMIIIAAVFAVGVVPHVLPACDIVGSWGKGIIQQCTCKGFKVIVENSVPVDGQLRSVCIGLGTPVFTPSETVPTQSGLPRPPITQQNPETATWNSYEDTMWKVVFKYPPGWQIAEGQFESGMILQTPDLQMTDYSHVQKGAFIYVPLMPAVLPPTWEDVFTPYYNDTVKESVSENIYIGGLKAKVSEIKDASVGNLNVYYRYPKPWKYSADTTVQLSFIDMVSAPKEYEANKKLFKTMLSTLQFTEPAGD